MAPNKKKTSPKRPKTNWFFACFGIKPKTTSKKKSEKSGGRKQFFKLCMPKLKVIIRKRRVSFDATEAVLKAGHTMIMLEATKAQQKLNSTSNTKELNKVRLNDNSNPENQLDIVAYRKQDYPPTTKSGYFEKKVTKDSLIGVSIMVTTLFVMSIWGRLCAILCMSAWLYCIPLLKMHKDAKPGHDNRELNIGSEAHMSKAVLKGLDHKTAIGIS